MSRTEGAGGWPALAPLVLVGVLTATANAGGGKDDHTNQDEKDPAAPLPEFGHTNQDGRGPGGGRPLQIFDDISAIFDGSETTLVDVVDPHDDGELALGNVLLSTAPQHQSLAELSPEFVRAAGENVTVRATVTGVPTPGVIALLGLAALRGPRRRRRY